LADLSSAAAVLARMAPTSDAARDEVFGWDANNPDVQEWRETAPDALEARALIDAHRERLIDERTAIA
jgi:hypothetical protein